MHQETTELTEAMALRWQEADRAVESLVAALVAAAARTADHSGRSRPRGRARPERRPKSTRRHIAEVVRAHQLAPGLRVDRNMVAALLIGHRDLVSNPVLVVAVAQACSIIEGRKLSAKKAARMRAASLRVAKLIARAEAATPPVPAQRPDPAPLESMSVDSVRDEPAQAVPAKVEPARADAERRRLTRGALPPAAGPGLAGTGPAAAGFAAAGGWPPPRSCCSWS
ncbi:hypothetical protein [Dactylosporangium cerinum]